MGNDGMIYGVSVGNHDKLWDDKIHCMLIWNEDGRSWGSRVADHLEFVF